MAKNHEWIPGKAAPLIRAHSRAKHRIIERYLQAYIATLTADPCIPELRVLLVDGFAGGGVYRHGETGMPHDGSPLIMLRAVEEFDRRLFNSRQNPVRLDFEYHFIEKDPQTFRVLEDNLSKSDFSSCVGKTVNLVHGEFADNAERLIRRAEERKRGQRAIFLLDQCGITGVPCATIRSILQRLPNAEVILTLSIDALLNHLSSFDPRG